MWSKSYSVVTQEVTKEQMWKLFADVNNWNSWDDGIEFAKIEGEFKQGNHFILRPKGGPNVKVELLETVENGSFSDVTKFPLAKMYDSHLFEDTEEGLRITNTIKVTGILGFLWRKIVAQNIVNNFEKDIRSQINAASKL